MSHLIGYILQFFWENTTVFLSLLISSIAKHNTLHCVSHTGRFRSKKKTKTKKQTNKRQLAVEGSETAIYFRLLQPW